MPSRPSTPQAARTGCPRPFRDSGEFVLGLTATPGDLPAITSTRTRPADAYPACAEGAQAPPR